MVIFCPDFHLFGVKFYDDDPVVYSHWSQIHSYIGVMVMDNLRIPSFFYPFGLFYLLSLAVLGCPSAMSGKDPFLSHFVACAGMYEE